LRVTAYRGWKVFRVRDDGTLGSLFFGRRRVLLRGQWLGAHKGLHLSSLAYRPGWHVLLRRSAPWLTSKKDRRVMLRVEARGVISVYVSPRGVPWLIAQEIRIR
jgi:hypothetical protein